MGCKFILTVPLILISEAILFNNAQVTEPSTHLNPNDCNIYCGSKHQCRFPDFKDCRNHIHCYKLGDVWKINVRPCGFGTHWSAEHKGCLDIKIANCSIDPCANSTVKSYKFQPTESDSSEKICGKHFICVNGVSEVDCCCDGYAFVEGKGCVEDPKCVGSCKTFHRPGHCSYVESSISETANTTTAKTEIVQANTTTEAETVQEPSNGIQNSESLGVSRKTLEIITGSLEATRLEQDPCHDPKVNQIGDYADESLANHGCRAFWACRNNVSILSCCGYGSRYLKDRHKCVQDTTCGECSSVPLQKLFCNTEGVPGHKRKYILNQDGRKFNQSCACGLRYVKAESYCGCVADKDWRNDPECTRCKPDVFLNFNDTSPTDLNCKDAPEERVDPDKNTVPDTWTAPGGQKAAELHGIAIVCSKDDNFKAGKFGSNSYVEIPFFKDNAAILRRFYMQIKFKTLNIGSTTQVLMSNCRFGEPHPSLEIIIDKGGNTLKFWASTGSDNASFSLPYENFQWNEVRLSYDGEVLKSEVNPETPNLNKQYNQERFLPGELLVSVQPGLRISSCNQLNGEYVDDYFHGYIKYIKIYSCKPEYKEMTKITPVVT